MRANTTSIEKQDVEEILGRYQGNEYFKRALEESTSSQDVAETVIKYVYFNRLFGAGVAHLASQLAFQTSLFEDSSENDLWNDRSMEVGSCVFAAAIDEFGDRGVSSNPTHRKLAQAVIKSLVMYTGYDLNSLDLSHISAKINPRVRGGYGVAGLDEDQLFRSIGFHIGSELLADQEFRILDHALCQRYPGLVDKLKDTVVTVSGERVPAYRWIEIHTTVEIDHFVHAVRAANMALQYYSGSQNRSDVKQQIIQGVEGFAVFQQEFMKYLCKGTPTLEL